MSEPSIEEQIAAVEAAIVTDGTHPRQIKHNEILAILSTLRNAAAMEALREKVGWLGYVLSRLPISTNSFEHYATLRNAVVAVVNDAARDAKEQK